MGCGGPATAKETPNITVSGDLFNTDTRTVLTILDMCEINNTFRVHERT